ncbi:MAG TPA: hypothetical protein PKE51_13005, partial [Gemmatimonadaceae bacterium]|nr:hypothetical protein [Gemmatimonadaceae bacterium]
MPKHRNGTFLRRITAAALSLGLLAAANAGEAQTRLTLSDAPIARFGESGSAAVQLSRVVAALRLADGSVIVADSRSSELHQFAATGRYLGRVAREGAGPNELEGIVSVWRTERGFAVRGGMRLTTFSEAPVREVARQSLPFARASAHVTGTLGNGVLFGTRGSGFRVLDGPPSGVIRDTSVLVMLPGASLTDLRPLVERPGKPSLSVLDASRPGGFRTRAYRQGHALHWAAGHDALWIGESGAGELLRFNADGTRADSLAAPFPARRWDQATVQRLARAAADPLDAAEWDRRWLPAAPPRFAELHADPGGGVWVEEFREDPAEPRELRLMEPRGAQTARLT